MIIDSLQHAFIEMEEQIRPNKSTESSRYGSYRHGFTLKRRETSRVPQLNSPNFERTSQAERSTMRLHTAIDETAASRATNPDFFTGLRDLSLGKWISRTPVGSKRISPAKPTPESAKSPRAGERRVDRKQYRYAHEYASPFPLWITLQSVTARTSRRSSLSRTGIRRANLLGHGGGYHRLDSLNAAKTRRILDRPVRAFSTFHEVLFAGDTRRIFSVRFPFDDPALRIDTLRQDHTRQKVLDMALGENAQALIEL
jgi:hypothetical protein